MVGMRLDHTVGIPAGTKFAIYDDRDGKLIEEVTDRFQPDGSFSPPLHLDAGQTLWMALPGSDRIVPATARELG